MRSSVFGEARGWKPLQTAGPAATTSQPLPQPYGHHRGQTDVCIPTHVQLLPAASPSHSAAQEVKILYKKSAAHLLSPTFLQKSPATISPSLLQTPPLQSIVPAGSRQLHTTKKPFHVPSTHRASLPGARLGQRFPTAAPRGSPGAGRAQPRSPASV